jgi:hypothetical protein
VDRGNGIWASLDDAKKTSSLIQATDYIDQRYGARFIGDVKTNTQALQWPRVFADGKGYVDNYGGTSEIPLDLQYATFEYAVRASQAPLVPDPVVSESGVTVITTRQKVGSVERAFAPVGGSRSGEVLLVRPYPGADMYLRDLLDPTALRAIR